MNINCHNNILGQQLLEQDLINYQKLKKALEIKEKTNQRLSRILRKEGIVKGRELYKILSNLLNNPSIDNYNAKIKDEIDFELLDSFDPRVLIEKQFLPINLNKDILKILIYDFKDKSIDKFLKTKFGDVLIEKVEVPKNIIDYLIEYSYKENLIDDEINQLIKNDNQTQKNLFTKGQLILIGIICIAVLTGIFFNFTGTINLGLYAANIFFGILILFKFIFPIFDKRHTRKKDILYDELQGENQKKLPLYTILVPLINNSKSLEDLILSLKNMNYPSEKMEVLFLLNDKDNKDRNILLNSKLPDNWKVIKVPKRLSNKSIDIKNLGLHLAEGEYITTYTPKDIPEPNQLKKVVYSFDKKSNDCFCLLAPYKYINTNSLLSKYINLELEKIIRLIQTESKLYNQLSMFIKGTRHYKIDKLRKYGEWDNYKKKGNTYCAENNHKAVTEIFSSITYSVADYNGINYYMKLFKNSLKDLLYFDRDLFDKIKHNDKDFFTYNIFLSIPLLTPLFYMLLVLVFILNLLVDKSVLNQYFLGYIINISITNLVILYFLNFYSIVKADTSIKLKEKMKMGLINPIFMIIKFNAVLKAIVQIIKNPYKLEMTSPDTHRDLMFMYINFKNK